jgi:Fur family ferric uptake transcriptional regulator
MDNQLERYEKLLLKNGLKRTAARLQVLNILSGRDSATSQPFLENLVGKEVDRVTLYRILKAFEEKGIIHKVLDAQGTANYAICSHDCSDQNHHDEHVHFNCDNCHQIFCLDDVQIPFIKLPKGFEATGLNLIATGICDSCNKQQRSS